MIKKNIIKKNILNNIIDSVDYHKAKNYAL